MSRRSTQTTSIQTFALLDSLICTMGALLVLMYAFASHGKSEVDKKVAAQQQEQDEKDSLDADYYRWRSANLRESRDKTKRDLEAEKLKLSHVEEHQRRLKDRLKELQIAATELDKAGETTAGEQAQKQALLAEIQGEIQRVRTAIVGAKSKGKHQAVNYSVMPYDGKYGTHRRPIYIECRGGRIILQPEGVVLTPRDFLGHFGPGNPLAAALRAQREYMARQAPAGKLSEEPYPLLLVRPDGLDAYGAARLALNSSGNEFGYELIGADWDLSYPPADPQLKDLTIDVIVEARRRVATYVAASPQHQKQLPRPTYHADADGVSEETGSEPADYQAWTNPQAGVHQAGRPGGANPNGVGDIASQLESDKPGNGLGSAPGSGTDLAQGTDPGSSTGAPFVDPLNLDSQPGIGSQLRARDQWTKGPRGANPSQGVGGAEGRNGSQSAKLAQNDKPGSSTTDSTETPQGNNYDLMAGDGAGGPGGGGGQEGFERDAAEDKEANGLHKPDGPKGTEGGDSMTPSDKIHLGTPGKAGKGKQSIAASRGHGWGVHSEAGTVGATRPVLVRCSADKLVIVSDMPRMPSQEIPMQSATEDAIDDLVSGVRKQTGRWGTAGKGMYWKPALVIEVQPGGEQRFNDLQQLMANSGLDVKRREQSPAAGQATRPSQQK